MHFFESLLIDLSKQALFYRTCCTKSIKVKAESPTDTADMYAEPVPGKEYVYDLINAKLLSSSLRPGSSKQPGAGDANGGGAGGQATTLKPVATNPSDQFVWVKQFTD